MANILSVDDDIEILALIKKALEREGHTVTSIDSAEKIDTDKLQHYDLILLDIMMPGMNGTDFCREIRNSVDCPIVFITAKVMDEDLCDGFSVGGDDYIKKPFSVTELRARVNAHLRREKREYHNRIKCGIFAIDLSAKQLYCNNDIINLTKSEYEICEFLIRNRGQVFSLEQIIEYVFGFESQSDIAAIREHIKNIRAKLSKFETKPIETVWGIGYKWT